MANRFALLLLLLPGLAAAHPGHGLTGLLHHFSIGHAGGLLVLAVALALTLGALRRRRR